MSHASAQPAHAKGANGETKTATLSADRKYLLVSGRTGTATLDEQGNWTFEEAIHDLQVIRISDGVIVDRFPVGVKNLDYSLPLGSGLREVVLNGYQGANFSPYSQVLDYQDGSIIAKFDNWQLVHFVAPSIGQVMLAQRFRSANTYFAVLDENYNIVLEFQIQGTGRWIVP